MRNHKLYMTMAAAMLPLFLMAQTSPNGKLSLAIQDDGVSIVYNQSSAPQRVITMPVKLSQKNPLSQTSHQVAYDMLLGKKSHCTNAYNELHYLVAVGDTLKVRLYNDGVAWHRAGASLVDVSSARNNWLMRWNDAYEDFFPENRKVKSGDRYGYPALFEYEQGLFALLTESQMTAENAATSMYATDTWRTLDLRPDGQEEPGWQTLIVGTLEDLVESTLVTDNSDANKLEDISWIEPGMASWIYWAHNHGSNDYAIIKEYIDMAVTLKLPYVLIDAEWDEMETRPDLIKKNKGKTITDAVRYANKKGIKPIIWYNSSVGWVDGAPTPKYRLNKPEDREREFAWCEKIGVKGVKIDFFSGDTNLNMRYMTELLECGARHHLLVNFHGATIPRGWQRTYPNFVTTEAVYGAEWYNNRPALTPRAAAHNATLPFTRNIIGSMDYTPCAFTDSQHPHITSHAHELALTVLFESGIQHLADRPTSLLAQPQVVRDFLTNLPTVWDETHLISGYPGNHAVMARRKGASWYVAGINGTDASKEIDLSKLSQYVKGVQNLTLIEDNAEALYPAPVADESERWQFSNPAQLPASLTLQARGGFVLMIQ